MITIPLPDLRPGDMLYRPLIDMEIFDHWGNYAGRDLFGQEWIFEHCNGGVCKLSRFDEFSKGYKVNFERIDDSIRVSAIERMKSLLVNPKDYDLINFNCEHAANYIAKGKSESKQIGLIMASLCILFIVFVSLRSEA